MLPTLRDGQTVVVVPTALHPPRAGDVVVARDPTDQDGRPWIKRIAVVGPASHVLDDLRDVDVPAGHVLLLGDNASASTDGRLVGPTPASDVTHVVVWPRSRTDVVT